MAASSEGSDSSRERRIDEVLAAYLEAVEKGEGPDRAELLARHPDIAGDLESYFKGDSLFKRFGREAGIPPGFNPREAIPDFGDYQDLKEIGRGGMGVVYQARQKSLNRVVALKVMLSGAFASEQDKSRFKIEAEWAAGLDHPNIVPIHEIGDRGGKPYFSMKFVDGGNLAQKFGRGHFDPRAMARLVETIARAVHFAHQRGILHRDLKPGNILLDAAGAPHLTDFGLAKRLDEESGHTRSGVVGTPSYMSPEQATGKNKQLTTATDVYSLGVILYEGLSGQPPFKSDSQFETLKKIITEDPVPPSRTGHWIPRDLQIICLKCLAKDPRRRYGSAEQLADELRRFLAGEPILARPATPLEQAVRWVRRRPVLAALIFLGASFLVGVAWLKTREAEIEHQNAVKSDEARKVAVREGRRGDRLLYASSMMRAYEAAERGDLGLVMRTLKKLHDHRRGFEFGHLLRSLSLSSGGWDWGNQVRSVAFSTDGRYLAGGGVDLRMVAIKEWDHPQFLDSGPSKEVAFSPDGKRLWALDQDGGIHQWEVKTGKRIDSFVSSKEKVQSMTLCVSKSQLVTGHSDGKIKLRDSTTGKSSSTISIGAVPIDHLAISGSGSSLAAVARDGQIHICDLAGTKEPRLLPFRDSSVSSISLSMDGRTLAVSIGKRIALWAAGTCTLVKELPEQGGIVRCLSFSPQENIFASAGDDRLVRVWDGQTGEELITFPGSSWPIQGLAFSSDGQWLASGDSGPQRSDGSVTRWDVRLAKRPRSLLDPLVLKPPPDPVAFVSFLPGGKAFVTASVDYSLQCWDIREEFGQLYVDPRSTWKPVLKAPATRGAISWDGRKGVVGFGDGSLTVFDFDWETKVPRAVEERVQGNHPAKIRATDFSRDSRRLATGSGDGVVKVWKRDPAKAVWEEEAELNAAQPRIEDPNQLFFSPDGKLLAIASIYDGDVDLWDVEEKRKRTRLHWHDGGVQVLAFSEDSAALVTGSEHCTFWNLAEDSPGGVLNSKNEWLFRQNQGRLTALLGASQGFLLIGDEKGQVTFWDPVWGDRGVEAVECGVLKGIRGPITAMGLSPDQTVLVVGGGPPGSCELKVYRAMSEAEARRRNF